MSNFPNSISPQEISSWRKWAQSASASSSKPNIAPGLKQTSWEPILPEINKSAYQTCGSCRRIRNR